MAETHTAAIAAALLRMVTMRGGDGDAYDGTRGGGDSGNSDGEAGGEGARGECRGKDGR